MNRVTNFSKGRASYKSKKKKDEHYKKDEHMKQDGMEMEKKGKRQAHGNG